MKICAYEVREDEKKDFARMAEKLQVEVPICNMVYQVLYKGKEPREGLELLFQRSLKEEFC